jgi:hypothetical protein
MGVVFSGFVAVLTFVAHHKLPYRRMLVLTRVLLGVVLVVTVGSKRKRCNSRTGSQRRGFRLSPV